MKCSKWERLVALYIEGDLSELKVRLVEKHLLTCPACLDFSENLKETQKHVRSLRNECLNETIYQEMRNHVMNEIAFGTMIRHRGTINRVFEKWRWKPLVAGALMMLLVVSTLWRRHTPDEISLPIASKEVERNLAQLTPGLDSAGNEQKPTQRQEMLNSVRLDAKKSGFNNQTSAMVRFRSDLPPHRTSSSHPTNVKDEKTAVLSSSPEPLYIELATGDPDVLIVWLIEPN